MLSEKSNLAQQFELEIWLYLDNELDTERMKFWEEQIERSRELKEIVNETKQVLNLYDSEALNDIDDPVFDAMVRKASANKFRPIEFIKRLLGLPGGESEAGFNTTKLAFGSMLIIAGFALFLISGKPNQVKNISSDLLDWEGESINEQINELNGGLTLIENDKLQEYLMYKRNSDKWSQDVFRIEKQLKNLMEKTDKKSL